MRLAGVLRDQIRKRGLAVKDLARKTKVPSQTLYNWMSGSKPRDFDQVKAVADELEMSLDHLLYGEQSRHAPVIEKYADEINAGTFEVVLRRPGSGRS